MKFFSSTLHRLNFQKTPMAKTPAVTAMPITSTKPLRTHASSTSRLSRPKPARNRTSFTLSHELMPKLSSATPTRDGRNTQPTGSRSRTTISVSCVARTRPSADPDPDDPDDEDDDAPSPFDTSNMSETAHDFTGESVKWKSFARYIR